jgi:DNA-directed RNA polymerase subunit K/omega
MQKCVAGAGNSRYDMCIMAAARAREIRHTHRTSQQPEHQRPIITALLELQNGEFDTDIINKIK